MANPFSYDFVMKHTIRHMERTIAVSTQKTIARVPEFEGDPEMLKEVMRALASLSRLHMMVESIRENNKDIFGDN